MTDPASIQIGMNRARSLIWKHMSGSDKAGRLMKQLRESAPVVEKVTAEDARSLLKAAMGRAR